MTEILRVKWETVMGVKYEGQVVERDNGTLIIACDDGKVRAFPVNGVDEITIWEKT